MLATSDVFEIEVEVKSENSQSLNSSNINEILSDESGNNSSTHTNFTQGDDMIPVDATSEKHATCICSVTDFTCNKFQTCFKRVTDSSVHVTPDVFEIEVTPIHDLQVETENSQSVNSSNIN